MPALELGTIKGSELVGKKYEPMFDFFQDRKAAFVVCSDGYVTNDSGTGIVHQVCLDICGHNCFVNFWAIGGENKGVP